MTPEKELMAQAYAIVEEMNRLDAMMQAKRKELNKLNKELYEVRKNDNTVTTK